MSTPIARNSKSRFAPAPILALLAAAAVTPSLALADEPSAAAREARSNIESTTQRVLEDRGRELDVTSRHRDDSPAHARGAIDYSSKDLSTTERHEEAREVSRALGDNHQVIVEEVHRAAGGHGPAAQENTTYQGGDKGATRWGAVKASGTHTHVQPSRAGSAQ